MATQTLEQFKNSFWRRVRKTEGGCWEWTGKVNNYGYGRCQFRAKELQAHRVSYSWKYGEIPQGMVIDQKCRNRKCVNPDHMEVVTNVENVMRGECVFAQKSRQSHCIHGHPLSGENLHIRRDGHRSCRTCERLNNNRYYHQQKLRSS